MPSDRSRKYKERLVLAEHINSHGTITMPCSSCQKHGRVCVILNEKSQRCGECVRRGAKCDVAGISPQSWEALHREEARLKFERDRAFEAAIEGLAWVCRLEKQQELL